MSQPPSEDASQIGFDHDDDYARLAGLLVEAGYTDDGIQAAMGSDAISLLNEAHIHSLLFKSTGDSPIHILIRLFLLSRAVDGGAAREALAPVPLEKWAAAGLVAVEGDRVIPCVRIVPFFGRWFAHDPPAPIAKGRATSDFVMGIGTSTMTLANITVRRQAKKVLDMGAGCGTHALLAADHCDEVYAVDRNPRATAFAAFNARLNGLGHVRCVTGDLFEPVEGHRFDLIVSNPPFVISPSTRFIFRDSGLRGDAFCRRLARTVPDYLEEGGYCQFLCNWVHDADGTWENRLARWFEGIGCDVWVMRSETRDASDYASMWIKQTEKGEPGYLTRAYDEWMAYYQKEGIERISTGIVMMRKASGGGNWFRGEDAPRKMLGRCGGDVEGGFALRGFVERVGGDAGLLDSRLRISSSVQLKQTFTPHDGGWAAAGKAELCRDSGLAYSGQVDQFFGGLIARCDGSRTLRELIQQLAETVHRPFEAVAPQVLGITRRLVEQGFLLPEGFTGETR